MSELNIPPHRRNSFTSDPQSILNPIDEFLNLFGLSIPFRRRKPDSPSNRFPDLYASSLHREHIELSQLPEKVSTNFDQFGLGHEFASVELKTPTWCDFCGEFLWGVYNSRNHVHCSYCNYTCHLRCRPLVALDCITQTTDGKHSNNTAAFHDDDAAAFDPLLEEIVDVDEEPEPPIKEPITTNDLRRQIDAFNANVAGSEMKLLDDGKSFAGFIRVHMKLCRPINVVAAARPPSIYDVLFEDETTSEKTLTSFYLPRDTVKSLHIASDTTTQEVIIALLNKFKVVDNPHKFALYERYYEVGESSKVRMRRIQDSEHPLQLVLMWNNQGNTGKQLVLQENDTGDIPWDSFSLPELSNFLRILQREEDEYLNQVRLKYSLMADKLQEELIERKPMLASGDPSLTAPIPPPRRRHSETLISGDSTMRLTSSTLPNISFENLPIERRQIRNVHSLRSGNVTSPGVVNGFGSKK